ncbi:MAG: hypothetical protein V4547_08340 [Bacteroidota bacterium]
MKTIITTLAVLIAFCTLAQNVGINSTGATPHASAVLDVDAAPGNDKGLLIPRIALLATNNPLPISAPATSLIVYNTATAGTSPNNVLPGFYYWNGTKWIAFGGTGGTDWSLSGNAGTVAGTNFIGTTDAIDFTVFTNNTEKVRVTSAGNVGIGTNSPNTTFDLAGSAAFREASITLANGNNNDIIAGNNSFINITGPAALFTITGITGGTSGRILTIYNSTAQSMTIANQSVSSVAVNRISTLTGADVITIAGNGGTAQLQYSATASRWILINGGQSVNNTIPSGTVVYVNLAACPTGWTELIAAQGRYIVGLTSGGTLAATSGTALSDIESRPVGQHSHTITDPGHNHLSGDFSYVFNGTFDWNFGGASPNVRNVSGVPVSTSTTGITINNSGLVAGTNAPYIQLKVCQKN